MTDENKEFPKEISSGTITVYGYTTEVRYVGDTHKRVYNYELNKEWLRIYTNLHRVNAPIYNKLDEDMLKGTDLIGYEAAEAIRWWFLARAVSDNTSIKGIETRIVQHKIVRTHSIVAEEVWRVNPHAGEQ